MKTLSGILFFLMMSSLPTVSFCQDTFYVKKKQQYQIAKQEPAQRFNWGDTAIKDSVLTYTVEYKKPGTNIWVVNIVKVRVYSRQRELIH